VATTFGAVIASIDTPSFLLQLSVIQISGPALVACIIVILLLLSFLVEPAFWQTPEVRIRRLIGCAILAFLTVAITFVPNLVNVIFLYLLVPTVAAFVVPYPGKPTYSTARFALWCGSAAWLGISLVFASRLLSISRPSCVQNCGLYDFDWRGSIAILLIFWPIGLALAVLLALFGISLRFMSFVGGLQPPDGRYARRS